MKMLQKFKEKAMLAGVLLMVCAMWEAMPVSAAEMPEKSVSENAVPVEGDTSEENTGSGMTEEEAAQLAPVADEETAGPEEEMEGLEEEAAAVQEEAPITITAERFQTINYTPSVLTDWQQVMEALAGLTPEALTGYSAENGTLLFQLQNVGNIPAEVKDAIASGDSGYTKVLQCGLGYGVSIVLNGATDNSGFCGISNTGVSVVSEKRGKKSVATTVRFEAHENFGTVASLQVSLPQCSKGTKVSVYAETVALDEEGNATVGENACIGKTKAGENGNIEIPIQSTANYMFVYKEAKE